MSSIITLTTDFGLADAYVAAMKGVILSINPGATLVDICHTISPQNIAQAAFVLGTAYQYFPDGTVHLVVVDPGVGSQRKAVVLRTPGSDFVAPDNGVLSYVIRESASGVVNRQNAELGPECKAFTITNPKFWRTPVSNTFHGRDIFAPVAAYISLGNSPAEFGEKVTSLVTLPLNQARFEPDGSLIGHVLHIDSFGNLITDITYKDLTGDGSLPIIKIGGQVISGLSSNYTEGEGLLALIGSSGHLEISVKGGSAGDFLNVCVGDEVRFSHQGIKENQSQ